MKSLWLGALLVLTGGLATAQIDSDTLTVNASRQMYAPRDRVSFGIGVTAGPGVGLEEIVAALQGAGITDTAFSTVRSLSLREPGRADWIFTFTAPFSKIQAAIGLLAAAQQTLAKQPAGLVLTFDIQGMRASAAVECPLADLMADAQIQARRLVDAAGLSLGPVLELSDGSFGQLGIPAFILVADRWFDTVSICSIGVKYKLLRLQQ